VSAWDTIEEKLDFIYCKLRRRADLSHVMMVDRLISSKDAGFVWERISRRMGSVEPNGCSDM
jgi:hypothetical protein